MTTPADDLITLDELMAWALFRDALGVPITIAGVEYRGIVDFRAEVTQSGRTFQYLEIELDRDAPIRYNDAVVYLGANWQISLIEDGTYRDSKRYLAANAF